MKIVQTVLDLQASIDAYKSQHKQIGFVPTMGALHAGHLSLVKQSKTRDDITVVSIFVNPTQFNDISDLDKYPRTLDLDISLLTEAKVDFVFVPCVEEIYPETDTRIFNFGSLEEVMEGKFRPNHFNGVAQVVSKLFDIVKPDRAYFGEKDFQQLAIIRDMVLQYNIPIEIVAVPIKREASGLAMSSRNKRLTASEQAIASTIYKVLSGSVEKISKMSVSDFQNYVIQEINNVEPLRIEYFEIVDGHTLQPIQGWSDSDYVVGCITVFCNQVRLIDNIVYKK